MTSYPGWTAPRTYDLETVLQTRAVGGVRIGTSEDEIDALLGPPEGPIAKLGRHSKMRVSNYGNLSLLLSKRLVVGISIDFHGNRFEMVRAEALRDWRMPEWTAFASRHGWQQAWADDILNMRRGTDVVSLTSEGVLHSILLS